MSHGKSDKHGLVVWNEPPQLWTDEVISTAALRITFHGHIGEVLKLLVLFLLEKLLVYDTCCSDAQFNIAKAVDVVVQGGVSL